MGKLNIAFLRQVRYIFRAEILTGQGLVVPHQSRKRYKQGKENLSNSYLKMCLLRVVVFFFIICY
jgi:hypothetical protein